MNYKEIIIRIAEGCPCCENHKEHYDIKTLKERPLVINDYCGICKHDINPYEILGNIISKQEINNVI